MLSTMRKPVKRLTGAVCVRSGSPSGRSCRAAWLPTATLLALLLVTGCVPVARSTGPSEPEAVTES